MPPLFVSGSFQLEKGEDTVVMVRKPNPVVMRRMDDAFEVKTDSGYLQGQAGDYLAYDPLTGHVWPVKASYVEIHYERFDAPAGKKAAPPKVSKPKPKPVKKTIKAKPKKRRR